MNPERSLAIEMGGSTANRSGARQQGIPGRRLAARPEVALFVLAFVAYGYFYQAGGWNQNSRFDLTRAIVEEQSLAIGSFVCANPHAPGTPSHLNTGDVSCRGPQGRCREGLAPGERLYCDKAPGVSFLAVPAYALVYWVALQGKASPDDLNAAAHAVTIWTLGVPSALAVVMIFLALGSLGVGTPGRVAVSLAYGFGTLAFPYATLMYGNSLSAAILVIAFSLLIRSRHSGATTSPVGLAGIGFLLAYSFVVEYSAALAVIPLLAYAASFLRPLPRLGWLILGMLAPGLLLAAYNGAAFGGPLTLSYEYTLFAQDEPSVVAAQNSYFGRFGLGTPSWETLLGISFSPFRGLFFGSPWLLLAVPGCAWWARQRGVRAEMVVCAAVTLMFFWLNSSLEYWTGGWGIGPRFLLPAIPFMAIAFAGLASLSIEANRGWRRYVGWIVYAATVGYSMFMMLAGTAVKPEVPNTILHPFGQFLWPRFFDGALAVNSQSIDAMEPLAGYRYAYSIGELLGLEGLASLAPLMLLVVAAGTWLWWTLNRQPEP